MALTRAKHFLFVIARCSSIVVNPYWRDLVDHARETNAVVKVPLSGSRQSIRFPDLWTLEAVSQPKPAATATETNRIRNSMSSEHKRYLPNGRGYQT